MDDRRRRRRLSRGSDTDEEAGPPVNGGALASDEDGSDHDEYESAESLLGSSSSTPPDESDVRVAGDGQESAKVDDDEDRRNPQYIPKRGNFYEHDDREDEEAPKEGEDPADEAKKKSRVWRSEQTERWGHDKFMEMEQAPKTREELVNAYGYDIRNEDNAPRARRRRRYGRGPNKYTRKWEDEEAYVERQPSSRGGRGGRGGKRSSPQGPPQGPQGPQGQSAQRGRNVDTKHRGGRGGRGGRFEGVGMKETKPGSGPRSRPPAPFPSKVDQAVEAKLDIVEGEMAKVRIEKQDQEVAVKPKRYSTQRQQVQEAAQNPPMMHDHRLPKRQGYLYPTTASGPPPSAPFLPATAAQLASYMAPGGVYASASQNLNQFGTVPVTVAPLMVGGPVLAQQHPHLAAVSSPEQVLLAAAAAGHGQGYAEVRGGVTYFNQVVPSRQPISKRPKAAIPIVDPSQVVAAQGAEHYENYSSGSKGAENNLEPVNNSIIVSEAAVM